MLEAVPLQCTASMYLQSSSNIELGPLTGDAALSCLPGVLTLLQVTRHSYSCRQHVHLTGDL